ncbi:MAG TPA: IS4 family transposase, partial [Candidatus Paceibacterota bacterium]|nr:IS4 family transposase [Candidatus Paceibacterota bacterium]
LGTSRNAVMSQLWVALCVYLMLAYLKFLTRAGWSLTQIVRLLQLNLFHCRSLDDILRPPDDLAPAITPQLSLNIA